MAIPYAAQQAKDWLDNTRYSSGQALPAARMKAQQLFDRERMLEFNRQRDAGAKPQNRLGSPQPKAQPPAAAAPNKPSGLQGLLSQLMGGMGGGGIDGRGFGGGGGYGRSQINTSITPQPIYSPRLTNMAVNQAAATAATKGNMPYLLSQNARPGISSRGPGSIAKAMPQVARSAVDANTARYAIPFSDATANATNMLAGQVGRENEALGWGGLQNKMRNLQRGLQTSDQVSLMQMLSSLA